MANRPDLKAHGVIIGSDGGLRGLSISQSDEKARLAGRLPEKELTKAKTDKVDAEIKSLKAKKAQLEQKIASEANPNANLQRQLAQIYDELNKKALRFDVGGFFV